MKCSDSPCKEGEVGMVLNSADYSAGPSTSTIEPRSVLVEAPTWELNSPSMAATGDFSLHEEVRSGLAFLSISSSLWNSYDFSAGPSTGTTGPQSPRKEGEVGMVLNSADYSAGSSTSTTELQSVAPTLELNSPGRHRGFFSSLSGPVRRSLSNLSGPVRRSLSSLSGPVRRSLSSHSSVLIRCGRRRGISLVDKLDGGEDGVCFGGGGGGISLDDELWFDDPGSPCSDLSFSSLRTLDDFSTGPSTGTTGPQPVLVEPPPLGVNSHFPLGDEFWSPALGSPCADLPFSSLWNSDDFSAAGTSTGTTGAPPVLVEPPTLFRLGKRTTVEVNKHLGLSEPYFFVVEFNHTPQGESINWRNVEINYPDIDKAFKEQESYVTLFERQVMVSGQKLAYLCPDAKDFSVLKKIRHGAYDLVLEVEDFLLNNIKHSKFSPDVDEGCEELEIVFGRMKLQNLKMKGISSGGVLMCIQLNGRYVVGRIDIVGQFCNGRPEITFGEGLQEEIFVDTTKSFPNNEPDLSHEFVQISQNTRSPQGPQAHPNGEDMQIASSEQQLTVDDFDVICNGENIVIIGQSDIPVTGSEKNNIKMISPLLSPEILPQLYGMKQDAAAKFLGVSRATLKRFCRKHGIWKWPFRKGKKGSNDLPKLNCGNKFVQGTEGALYQPSLTIDPINRVVGSMCWPAELRRSNLQQTESIPSAYCVPNAPVSMQPRTSAGQMPTELIGCSEFLKCLHASEQAEVVLESTETVPPCSELPLEHGVSSIAHPMPHVATMQDMKTFNIKARHRIGIIQFPLSSSSRKAKLEENISERLNLNLGNFRINYMDTEGDWILITCDKDLQYCMTISERLGHHTIKMLVEDITTM